jgi:hemolysin III
MASSAIQDRALADAPEALRPWLRGSMHRWSVPVSVVLSIVLAARVDTGGQLAAIVVYGVCITAMLGVSGLYHARRLYHRERRFLRRLDHTMILVGTAGTYTALIVLALDGTTRIVLLVVAWAFVVVGAGIRMLWLDAPAALIALVYLVAGWQALLAFPAYLDALDAAELTMVAVGGGLYSVGAVVYALKRPNPWPAVFGFHELFHTFVVGGAACHWVALLLLTTG